jgi:hypothetical protein
MTLMSNATKVSKIVGWVLCLLVAAFMLMGAAMKLQASPEMLTQWEQAYPKSTMRPIGAIELACVVLFLIPRTSALGGILLVGYLGGAVSHNVRTQSDWILPVVIGVVAWIAICLRDAELWSFVPLRSKRPANPPTDNAA